MQNTLTKDTKLLPMTVSVMVAPEKPSYSTIDYVYSCAPGGYEGVAQEGEWISYTDPTTGEVKVMWLPANLPEGGSYQVPVGVGYSYVCSTKTVVTNFPAIPAVYSDVTVYTADQNIGWNSGGRSILSVDGDAEASFKSSSGVVGAIVGLKTSGQSGYYSGNDIDFAYYLHSGSAQVMQKGVVIADAGSFSYETSFSIRRQGSDVVWLKDGQVVRTERTDTLGLIWLEASLYMAGDYIDSPTLVHIPAQGEIDMKLRMDLLLANHAYAELAVGLPALKIEMNRLETAEINIKLPGLAMMLADHVHAEIELGLPIPTPQASTYSEVIPQTAVLEIALPLQLLMESVAVKSGQIDMVLPAFSLLAANFTYREMVLDFPTVFSELGAYVGTEVLAFGSFEQAESTLAQQRILTMDLESIETEQGATLEPARALLELSVQEVAHTLLSWAANFMWSLSSQATPQSSWVSTSDDATTWACGLDGAGSTSYGNFGFNSYARIGGHCFGARPDGLFLLEGDTDAGETIPASIGLGQLEMGSKSIKLLEAIYVGMSGSAPLVMSLGVPDDVGEQVSFFDYQTRGSGPSLVKRRVDAGRGLRANYFEVDLFNVDGADFSIDTLEFLVADTSRRIK